MALYECKSTKFEIIASFQRTSKFVLNSISSKDYLQKRKKGMFNSTLVLQNEAVTENTCNTFKSK